jgi:C-terminal processing protease CtpA/Prc
MAIPAVSLETPYGRIRKLANGLYRLKNSAPYLQFLLDIEYDTFSFLIDEGFVIKSYKYTKKKKGEKEIPIDLGKFTNTNLNSLPDMLDFMAQENFSNIHLYTANLTIDLERYKKIRLGVMIQPSNDKKEGILIHRVIKGSIAEKHGILDNDILIKVNNTKVNTMCDLEKQVDNSTEGKILLSIKRNGIEKSIQILNNNLKK